MRGERAARISVVGGEVAIAIALPEPRDVRVNDANFASIGPELHDAIVRLARDARLLDGAAARAATRWSSAAPTKRTRA